MVAVCGPIITARGEGGARRSGWGAVAAAYYFSLLSLLSPRLLWLPLLDTIERSAFDLCNWARRCIARFNRRARIIGSTWEILGVGCSYVIPEELPLIGRKHGDLLKVQARSCCTILREILYLRSVRNNLIAFSYMADFSSCLKHISI